MIVQHIGGVGVHAHTEQASGGHALPGCPDVRHGFLGPPVLEDLDPDDDRVASTSMCRQVGEVPDHEPISAIRETVGELSDGRLREIESGEIQPTLDERHVVPTVATADVHASPKATLTGSGDDVVDEGDGWLGRIATGSVLRVPRRSDAAPFGRWLYLAGPYPFRYCAQGRGRKSNIFASSLYGRGSATN